MADWHTWDDRADRYRGVRYAKYTGTEGSATYRMHDHDVPHNTGELQKAKQYGIYSEDLSHCIDFRMAKRCLDFTDKAVFVRKKSSFSV